MLGSTAWSKASPTGEDKKVYVFGTSLGGALQLFMAL